MIERIKKALNFQGGNLDLVLGLREKGVSLLLQGKTEESLKVFFEALKNSFGSPRLQALCLTDFGDWSRRVEKDVELADALFKLAESIDNSALIKSRIYCMKAMFSELILEKYPSALTAVSLSVVLFKLAVYLGLQDKTKLGVEALNMAFHRWGAFMVAYGSKAQQEEAWEEIQKFADRQRPRIRYVEAMLMAGKDPERAISILQEISEEIKKESPSDASYWREQAEEIRKQEKRRIK